MHESRNTERTGDRITRAIVILPSFTDPAPIERLRRKYDPLANFIAPHITLVFPFTSDITTEALAKHMRQATKDLSPFDVTLREVTGHLGEYLFLNVKRGANQLIALHDQLYSGMLSAYLAPEQIYTPHLTVGRLDSAARFAEALADARQMTARFTFRVEEIVAYRISGEQSRPVECRLSLGD